MSDFLKRTDGAYQWYKTWNEAKLILSFKGDFNQEMVRSLTVLTRGKDVVKGIGKQAQIRLMGILIECMQNISMHGAAREGQTSVPGIILISNNETSFTIASGNIVSKANKESLVKKLEEVNKMTEDEKKEFQKAKLMNSSFDEKSGGIGLVYISRRIVSKLRYNFTPYDDNNEFYSFEVDIAAR